MYLAVPDADGADDALPGGVDGAAVPDLGLVLLEDEGRRLVQLALQTHGDHERAQVLLVTHLLRAGRVAVQQT